MGSGDLRGFLLGTWRFVWPKSDMLNAPTEIDPGKDGRDSVDIGSSRLKKSDCIPAVDVATWC